MKSLRETQWVKILSLLVLRSCEWIASLFHVVLVMPGVNPDAEGKDVVDPLFQVIFLFLFSRDGFTSRKAVRSKVLVSWNVDKLEVEKKDGCNLAVHGCIWLHIQVA